MCKNKFKTRHDWMGKVIHWELSKKFQFDHTNKWYMHNPGKWNAQTPLRFWDKNGSPNLGKTTRPNDSQQKKKKKKRKKKEKREYSQLST